MPFQPEVEFDDVGKTKVVTSSSNFSSIKGFLLSFIQGVIFTSGNYVYYKQLSSQITKNDSNFKISVVRVVSQSWS